FARGAAQSAVASARREAADVNAGVLVMVGHADAIAQHGAAGKRARRIDREDGDFFAERAVLRDQAVDERRFSGARRPGYSHHLRAAGLRVDSLDDRARLGGAILDHRDELGERAHLARLEAPEEGVQPRVFGLTRRGRLGSMMSGFSRHTRLSANDSGLRSSGATNSPPVNRSRRAALFSLRTRLNLGSRDEAS